MKIGICGDGRSGKDTAAEFLRDEFGLRYTHGTSRWAASLVWANLNNRGFNYQTLDDCYAERHKYRKKWADIIGAFNASEPTRMYRNCLQNQDVLVGIRWRSEFLACRAANLCDAWLYISRPGTSDPTNEITPADCDYVIRNDGTLDQFREKLRLWAGDLLRSTAHAVSLAQRS